MTDRQAISDLSFSHDGEYLAIAGAGSYIDIVRANFFFFFCSFAVIQGVLLVTVRDRDGCADASRTRASQLAKGNVASVKLRHCVLRANETT